MVMIYSIIRMNCLTLVAIGRKLQNADHEVVMV